MARKDDKQQDVSSPAQLTGHTTKPVAVEDETTGKVQALHTTEVITDPDHELAVQGHDDPRVSGVNEDPLRREPSPNEQAEAGEADVTVSGDSDEADAAAGRVTDEDKSAASDND